MRKAPNAQPANCYLRGTIASLESRRPEAPEDPPVQLTDLDSLKPALAALERRSPTEGGHAAPRLVLIFDQFEEVLTTSPFNMDLQPPS